MTKDISLISEYSTKHKTASVSRNAIYETQICSRERQQQWIRRCIERECPDSIDDSHCAARLRATKQICGRRTRFLYDAYPGFQPWAGTTVSLRETSIVLRAYRSPDLLCLRHASIHFRYRGTTFNPRAVEKMCKIDKLIGEDFVRKRPMNVERFDTFGKHVEKKSFFRHVLRTCRIARHIGNTLLQRYLANNSRKFEFT
jgi:hypothetical protein